MTDEYKGKILDYITGKLTPTQPINEEIFKEQNNIPRSWWDGTIAPSSWNNFRYEGMVAPNELTSNLTVLYGGYLDTNNNSHGIITLVDENFKPIKTIYEYSSGTPLRYIQYMKQADDGTFYFIDDAVFSYSQRSSVRTSQKRFVMTNNFTLIDPITNNYTINLRTSYIFGSTYQNFYCKNMYKDPNSSHYILFGSGVDNNQPYYDYRILKIIDLKINVGEENEWNLLVNENQKVFGSAIALFDSNSNVQYRCLVTNNLTDNNDLMCYSKTFEGNPTSNVIITFNEYKPYVDDSNYKKQSVFLNYDEVYFVQNNQRWGTSGVLTPKYIGLYKYNFSTSELVTVFEKYLGDYDFCNFEAIYIDKCNTDLYIQYNNNIDSNHKGDFYFQRLVNNEWNPILISEQKYCAYNQRTIFIKNNFNLLSVFLYQTNPRDANGDNWFTYQIKENYNVLNYNGIPYTNFNSLISQQGEIYSNNNFVFARNLYNKTINNNTTVSTIQVPNSYLNNIDLSVNKLLSETKTEIVNNDNVIQKNIYEMLFINYINTLNTIDEDENILYNNTSNYINENINVGTETNMKSTFISKVRINYIDNTFEIKKIFWTDIDSTHKFTKFSIYLNKEISNVDFISDDESQIYITKNFNDYEFEIGNTYTITQYLRIE